MRSPSSRAEEFDARGKPLPVAMRVEKIERGQRLAKAIAGRGTGNVPAPPRRAYEALVADLAAAALIPEWDIEKAMRAGSIDGTKRPPTPREVEFAQGYANGETGNELAHRLGVKMESVSRSFDRLQFNLGARSRYQAIAMLVYAGYCSAPVLPTYARSGRGVRAKRLTSTKGMATRSTIEITKREVATLVLMAEGLTAEEIAERLGDVTLEGIKSRIQVIIRKLDARNRTHAVALAFRVGLLD